MTSTSGFTEGLSRVGLSRITTFKHKTNPWPEVHLSIGKSLCLIGKNRCWEAVGPAKEQFSQVHEPIRQLLESHHEQLNKDISVRKNIFLDIFMIGPTEEQARPTVIFSCENKIQRQRAQKLVRSSNILDKHTGFRLGDSSRPPRTNMSPRTLGDEAESGMEWEPNTSELLIYHSSPIKDVYSIPIFIQRPNAQKGMVLRKSTVGGIISIHSKFFGLTVAHVFLDEDDEENGSDNYDAMELSLEDDDEEIFWGSNEDELIDTTSRGSVSPRQDENDDSESSLSIESLVLDLEAPSTPHPRSDLEQVFQQIQNNQNSAMTGLERIGLLTKTSSGIRKHSLDWAVIEITSLEIFQAYRQLTTITHVKSIVKSLPKQNTTVASVTLSGGRTTGTITTNPTFMQLTTGIAFQEVWTVQLDSILGYGDCGSWVTSPDGQSLYGYITAGDPSTSIAYIIPAHHAFSDIELAMGGQITFPVLDALPKDLVIWSDFRRTNVDSSRNRTRNLFPLDYDSEEVDETSEAEGQSLWDEVIGLVKGALSSRPTTPSDALSLDLNHEESSFSDCPPISNQARSEDFRNSDTTSSKFNHESGSSVKTRSLLPTICELVTHSFDADSSSVPGDDKILCSTNSFTQSYGYNQQQTHQHCYRLYSGQHSKERTQHNASLADTRFSPSPQTKACWACHVSKSKILACVPGSLCEQCYRIPSKISIQNQPRLKEPLESLAGFLVPRYLMGHFTKANVENFVNANVGHWGKQSIAVRLSWGYKKLLDIEVFPLKPRRINSVGHHSTVLSSNVTGLQLIRKRSPPLGIPLADIDDMKYKYYKYIRDIVDGDLSGYLPVAYTDQESLLPERLLTTVCSYYTAATEKDMFMELLLRDAIEMHVAATILERSLVLDEISQNRVEELLGEKFHERSAPRVAQRQIKLAIFMTQAARIRYVLHGWGRLMSRPGSTTTRSQDWPTAICVFLMMVLVMDKIIGAAWYFCEANILHDRRDAREERKKFMELVTLTQTELFERCKEIFHSRFNTREGGNRSFNPVRDGVEAWQKQVPNADVKALTRDLQAIVQEFETEIREHGSGVEENEFMYAGRLACIFLDDLLSR